MRMRTTLHCPFGCGQTIDVTPDGFVLCTHSECPDSHAIAKIFAEDSLKHRVKIHEGHWSAMHPLFERIDGKLLDCGIEVGVGDARDFGESEGEFWMWYDKADEEWKWNRITDDAT